MKYPIYIFPFYLSIPHDNWTFEMDKMMKIIEQTMELSSLATDFGYLAGPTYRSQGWHPTQIPQERLRQHVLDVEIPRKSSRSLSGSCEKSKLMQIWSFFCTKIMIPLYAKNPPFLSNSGDDPYSSTSSSNYKNLHQFISPFISPIHFTIHFTNSFHHSFHHSSSITQSFSSPARLSGANRYFVVSSYGEKSPLPEACWTRPLLGEKWLWG